jgi:hypothetical protein
MDFKKCFKCKINKPIEMFYKHPQMADGYVNKCKECNKKDVRENRAAKIDYYREYDIARSKTDKRKKLASDLNKRWKEINQIKRAAHILVGNAIRSGRLIKQNKCCECGKSEGVIHGHHDDYTKPLDVRWLCVVCHSKWHKENGEGKI